jgi:hypothetical protein
MFPASVAKAFIPQSAFPNFVSLSVYCIPDLPLEDLWSVGRIKQVTMGISCICRKVIRIRQMCYYNIIIEYVPS